MILTNRFIYTKDTHEWSNTENDRKSERANEGANPRESPERVSSRTRACTDQKTNTIELSQRV